MLRRDGKVVESGISAWQTDVVAGATVNVAQLAPATVYTTCDVPFPMEYPRTPSLRPERRVLVIKVII
jgi:hypothetical protein